MDILHKDEDSSASDKEIEDSDTPLTDTEVIEKPPLGEDDRENEATETETESPALETSDGLETVKQVIESGRCPFDVTLKGGRPWGFALDGGRGSQTPLYISKIVSGSKSHDSALLEGDYLLRVNDTPCTDVGQALDLVDTCLDVLTLTVLRGPQLASSSEPVRTQSYLQRVLGEYRKQETGPGNLRHSFNDDSALYRSTRLTGMKPHKPRGESFSIGQQQRESYQNRRSQPPPRTTTSRPSSYHVSPSSSGSSNNRRSLPSGQPLLDRERSDSVSTSTDSTVAAMNRRRSEGSGLSTGSRSWAQQQQQLASQQYEQRPQQREPQPHALPHQQPALSSVKSSQPLPSSEGPVMTPPKLSSQPHTAYSSYPSPTQGSPGIYSSAFKNNNGRSIPSHNLQRYQPDYENMSHYGLAPLGSEKISEIDDIEEVTSKDLSPIRPDVKMESGLEDMPTRDINSLKYIKVNQSHEKYPSWPVSRPNETPDQSQSINSRAQSMTDHTDTSNEFPKKQTMAYTPGLRPLPEKISPLQERKEEGKIRNSSDPGFKSEFVHDRFGRVQRRNFDNVEQNFADFYQNSKAGYPPPSMDPDGHNIGDKHYNAPSPPERDNGGADVNQRLSSDITKTEDSATRPTNLNINPTASRVDSGTSPLESADVSFAYRTTSNKSHAPLNQRSTVTKPTAASSPMSPAMRDNPFPATTNSITAASNRAMSFKDSSLSSSINKSSPHSNISRNRPMSQGSASSSGTGGAANSGSAYIVKQTPYYNTSTQTDMLPYSIKIKNPTNYSNTPMGHFATQTSPVSPDDQRKLFDEKSEQARLSKDFQSSEKTDNRSVHSDIYRYPSNQSSFLDYEGIQAKYSTDEAPGYEQEALVAHQKYQSFGDNTATMLRKLSEEFYKGRYNSSSSDKRNVSSSSSGQELSPRYDPGSVFQQPGMREAESYSSVVIHPDVHGGLFGRDEIDSKHNISMSESSGYKSLDLGTPMSRYSLDSSVMNLKMSQELQKPTGPGTYSKHFRESSVPVSSRYQMRSEFSPSNSDLVSAESATPIYAVAGSHAKSKSSTDPQGIPSMSDKEPKTALHIVEDNILPLDGGNRISTDSVFLEDVSKMDDSDLPAFEFVRKPSMRKAYGIYDETESLLAQTKPPSKAQGSGIANTGGARDSIPPNPKMALPRGMKHSESASLGLIQEEGDGVNQEDLKSVPKPTSFASEFPMLEKLADSKNGQNTSPNLNRNRQSQQQQQYAWQNESWRKERPEFDVMKRSNLKRTASEQIALPKQNLVSSSLDAESNLFNKPADYNKENQTSHPSVLPSGPASAHHLSRMSPTERSSSTGSPNEPELKKVQQQAVLNFFQRKTTGSVSDILHIEEDPSGKEASSSLPLKSPLSENSWAQNPSTSVSTTTAESVSDIISKANENLAKSAQRVDSIRRSSSSFRHSADYMDMTRPDRMRKETEWSKLRSSGSLRYSPDNSFRSNRSSFASENHYEDINLFAVSPGDSADTAYHEQQKSDPSMDSGFAGSNSYQNYPSQRRPPPAVPSAPSPDGPPPALPPRNYNKTVYVNSDNFILSCNPSSSQGVATPNKNIPPAIHTPQHSTTPFKDAAGEDAGIDHSKKDFKSLMTQWENSSPREEGYAAKLRKEAQRYTIPKMQQLSDPPSLAQTHHLNHAPYNPQSIAQYGGVQQSHPQQQSMLLQQQQQQQQMSQQQQHAPSKSTPPNAIPMALMHSRTAINFSTTYKRQPTVPQEATLPLSPTSCHPPYPSFPMPSTTNGNAGPPVAVSISSLPSSLHMPSAPHQMSSNSYALSSKQPHSVSSHHGNSIISPSSISTNNNASNNRQSVASSVGSSSTGHHSPAASNISFSSSHSSNSMDTTPPPRLPERAGNPAQSSPSPSLHDQKSISVSTGGIHLNRVSPSSRDTTSYNSHMDGKQSSYRSPQAQNMHSPPSKVSSPASNEPQQQHQTKWKPKRGPVIPSPPLPPDPSSSNNSLQGDLTVGGDTDFPPPPPEVTQQPLDSSENEVNKTVQGNEFKSFFDDLRQEHIKFSEDSYIGHKNKTSRPIGSYKRSKSAAALPSTEKSNANGVDQDGAGGGGSAAFADRTALKPSWNSDWALRSHDDFPPTSSSTTPTKEDLTRAATAHAATSSSSPSLHNQQLAQPPSDPSDAPPIRPARPSVSSRKELVDSSISSSNPPSHSSHSPPSSLSTNPQSSSHAQYKSPATSSPSSTSSSLPYHVPPDSSTAAGTPVFTAKPFVISPARRIGQENNASPNNTNNNSPRRAPPPVPNSPPYEPPRDSPLARTPGSNISNSSCGYSQHQHVPHIQSHSPQASSSSSSSPYISPSPSSSSSSLPAGSSLVPTPSIASPHRSVSALPNKPPSHNNNSVNNYPPLSSHVSNFHNVSNFNNASIPTSNNIDLQISEDQPPTLPPPREQQHGHHRRESEPMKSSSTTSSSFNSLPAAGQAEFLKLQRHKSEASGLNGSRPGMGDSSSGHSRQPSQEELECDRKAKQLAEELGEKDVKLSEVLSSDTNKKRMRYMDGLFSEMAADQNGEDGPNKGLSSSARSIGGSPKAEDDCNDVGKRTSLPKEYWLSAPKAQIEMTLRHSQESGNDLTRDIKDGHSLVQQKEELLKKLRKKLEVLEEDKVQLTQEIEDNNTLGKQVDSTLASKFMNNPGVVEKYKAYVEDQDKIVRLLLNLSGQLARAENAVEAIPVNSDSRLKKLTVDKRERLHAKHEEAKVLKADIDKRKDQVSLVIQDGLEGAQWQSYTQFINKRPQLTIELQELEDKIKLGTEQMEELKKSIPNTS